MNIILPLLFTSAHNAQRERAAAHHQETPTPELYPPNIVEPHKLSPKISIREHLRLWQEQHSADKVETTSALSEPRDPKGVPNLLTRIDAEDTIIDPIQNEHDNDPFPEAEMGPDGVVDFEPIRSYMSRGDLVELSLV